MIQLWNLCCANLFGKRKEFNQATMLGITIPTQKTGCIWTLSPATVRCLQYIRVLLGLLTAIAVSEVQQQGRAATLSGALTPLLPGTLIDLTAQGTSYWAHWGLDPTDLFDHKLNATQQISSFTLIGGAIPEQEANCLISFTWTDGSPTASATNTTTALSVTGLLNGFQISAPADTTVRELKIYVGTYSAQAELAAQLSDSSTPPYVDYGLNDDFDSTNGVYTLTYAAASAGQILTVSYTVNAMNDLEFGSVSLEAASLVVIGSNMPPSVTLTSPAQDSSFGTSKSVALAAEASDADGSIRKVEFYDGARKIGAATNTPYTFLWTNPQAGIHQLT